MCVDMCDRLCNVVVSVNIVGVCDGGQCGMAIQIGRAQSVT